MPSTPNPRSARKTPARVSTPPSHPSREGPPTSDRPSEGGKSVTSLAKLELDAKILQTLPSPDLVHWVEFPPATKGKPDRKGCHVAYQSEPDGKKSKIYAILTSTNRADEVSYFKVDLADGGFVTTDKIDNLHVLHLTWPWPFNKKKASSKSSQTHDKSLRDFCNTIVRQLALNCKVTEISRYSDKSRKTHEKKIRKIVDDISDEEAEQGDTNWRDFFEDSLEGNNQEESSGTSARKELESSQESNAEDKVPSIWDSYRIPTAYQSMELADIGKKMRRVMILKAFIEWEWKIEESPKIRWPLQPSEQRDQLCDRFIAYAIQNPETSLDMIGFRWLEETSTHLHSTGITMDIKATLKEKKNSMQTKKKKTSISRAYRLST
ncbi:Sucrase ferredoxin domain-containing protein [Lasiodiplodia theobromae]|uniref:Sucrase ferredoxin domain-containing protein n=1 Tax=Lasiodiplodia theobromae TaxID=45133 RepID=UPI0015C3EB0D|nr:Sucrase ferredoxin domain-containing protein [Lasiodiplodia theobromae]KAF4545310.1 Sucrase ferredoxin domain-containing protein [Lasiodiplodia theobromae]